MGCFECLSLAKVKKLFQKEPEKPNVPAQCRCCYYTMSQTKVDIDGSVYFTTGWRYTPAGPASEGYWAWWHGEAPHMDPTGGVAGGLWCMQPHAPRCPCCYYNFTSTVVDPGWHPGHTVKWVWPAGRAPHRHLFPPDIWEKERLRFLQESVEHGSPVARGDPVVVRRPDRAEDPAGPWVHDSVGAGPGDAMGKGKGMGKAK